MFILVLSILKGSAAASLPFVTPIHQISLLDYALTHNTVNSALYSETNASSSLTASADDTYIIDTRKEPSRSQDLYTSKEQRRRDQYEIDQDNWHEVAFEEVNGTSTCRLALHNDWIINHGYAVDGIVEMNLPEQGISGPFKITAIKHILPQKRPVDEDPDDEWEYKPVTGLFTHRSDQVHTLAFASDDDSQIDTLGVTAAHPIFSTTHHDWRLAGELEAGEKVLTYYGEATVLSNERKPGNEYVYNLEVKDLHNFLVGDFGVVVHNICWKEVDDFFKLSLADKRKMISESYDAWYPQIFARRSFLEGIIRKTKYKDWKHTYDLAKNFKAIDFYRHVNGKYIVSSMKTTKLDDVQSWISQNTQHLQDLIDGQIAKKFDWGPNNSIPADIVQLNLFTKKGLSATERTAWKNAIESHTNGKIQVIVEVIEENL